MSEPTPPVDSEDKSFQAWPKIPRLKGGCVITEKIDGTNAHVLVPEDGGEILVGSRNRYITPNDDNYGFANWCKENESKLRLLGPGRHYGEWWGPGIQRRYGVAHKRFSLFNTARWNEENQMPPDGIFVVPVLYKGVFEHSAVQECMDKLQKDGSVASPGFMLPEGVVTWVSTSRSFFKSLFDDRPKSQAAKESDAPTVGV